MGIYSEYLAKNMNFSQLNEERKVWLRKVSELRGDRCILSYAGDVDKIGVNSGIEYADFMFFSDQLATLKGHDSIDIILETPGGQAEIVEQMVKAVRSKFSHVGIIVPGMAKSAGTIFAMAGDQILMGPDSALGPIDAQMTYQGTGKRFSAGAFLDGLEKIKEEIAKNGGRLNPMYIPILQSISPGEIQACENAQAFSRELVKDWLTKYKFSQWLIHSSTGTQVSPKEREDRAASIADKLCQPSSWLTHGRSINIEELRKLKLEIIDYSDNDALNEAITRYFVLLSMLFDNTNIYKVVETPESQIYRHMVTQTVVPQIPIPIQAERAIKECADINYVCPRCKFTMKIQANLNQHSDLKPGFLPFPVDNNTIVCTNCGLENNLSAIRLQIEAQTGKRFVE
ncbi:MAG: ATP-dependent Clp protease proteolytic subunit [Treponema sp.]|jgi:hypothetical protein|nr:ATP-dependent Clp protease proteolytic subunit [Treponema sp.]